MPFNADPVSAITQISFLPSFSELVGHSFAMRANVSLSVGSACIKCFALCMSRTDWIFTDLTAFVFF